MKKAIYIWMLCLGGLFIGQQSFAQRNNRHRNNGHHTAKTYKKSYKKAQKKYHKNRAKAFKRVQKQRTHYNNRGKHKVFAKNHGRYNYHRKTPRYNHHKVVRRPVIRHKYRAMPWAPRHHYNYRRHVYFPDYHAFYDARRHGYVYRHRGRWIFTQMLPSFMVGLNWNNVRIQYLRGVPVSAYPQQYYDTYASRYPAVSLNLHLNL